MKFSKFIIIFLIIFAMNPTMKAVRQQNDARNNTLKSAGYTIMSVGLNYLCYKYVYHENPLYYVGIGTALPVVGLLSYWTFVTGFHEGGATKNTDRGFNILVKAPVTLGPVGPLFGASMAVQEAKRWHALSNRKNNR